MQVAGGAAGIPQKQQQPTPAAGQLTVRAKRLTASRGLVCEELAGSTRSKIYSSSSTQARHI